MKITSKIERRPLLKVTIGLDEREALLLALFVGRHSWTDIRDIFKGVADESVRKLFCTDESIEDFSSKDITNLQEIYDKIKNEFVQNKS